jgi:2,4-dienoyl-CoA reductase-like NADH-dependent reductase (Old Yellow Enzyme family)
MKKDTVLFSSIQIGPVTISNRFVRSATHEFMAERDGSVSTRLVKLLRSLAEGQVGLIITGHAYVNPDGKASPFQTAVYDDRFIPGLKKITQAVHEYPSRIFLQISHAGRQTKEKLCGCTPLAPTSLFEPTFEVQPREMTPKDIKRVISDFISAGVRAKQAGFDGIQLHIAHGYLLSSFISPYTNRRTDEWGGNSENRAKIVVRIIQGIQNKLGPDFPMIVKLNSTDFIPGGLSFEGSVLLAKLLEERGVNGIEVSGGMAEAGKGSVWKGLRPEEKEGYFVNNASRIKDAVSIPVFGLGGIRSVSVMEKIITEGRADLISLSRPFIQDPGLVKKIHQGTVEKSGCISCNKCFNPRGIRCAVSSTKKRS